MGRHHHWILLSVPMALMACNAPSGSIPDFNSPAPGDRMAAIVVTVREGAENQDVNLVRQLASEDAMIRFMAINALAERHEGRTLGFQFDGSYLDRQDAIRRWVDYIDTSESPDSVPDDPEDLDG